MNIDNLSILMNKDFSYKLFATCCEYLYTMINFLTSAQLRLSYHIFFLGHPIDKFSCHIRHLFCRDAAQLVYLELHYTFI